jgi:large subunit ribosomal protein L18
MTTNAAKFQRRKRRNRYSLRQKSAGRVRLTLFRSGRHIYAQIVDDAAGKTLCAASTVDKDVRGQLKKGTNRDAAAAVGKVLATRAVAAGIKTVVFDRGAYLYHGRVKALADAARESGLSF